MAGSRPRRLILTVIDGLGYHPLRRAIAAGHAPTLSAILDAGGHLDQAVSPYPSLTPVCLATIATGTLPDVHGIPSLAWFHRDEHRFVEYGSSWAAATIESLPQSIEDSMRNLNHVHLSHEVRTIFEALEDDDLIAASINYLIWRGRNWHTIKYPKLSRVAQRFRQPLEVEAPTHFFFGELFGSDGPRMPQLGIKRPRDWSGSNIARWLLRNADVDFMLLYLGEHDLASHKAGPEDTARAIRIADRSIARVVDTLGGIEKFTEQCALVVCADHGQSAVLSGQNSRIESAFPDVALYRGGGPSEYEQSELAIAPSNRFAQAYLLHGERLPARMEAVARRMRELESVDIVAHRKEPGSRSMVVTRGDATLIATPDGGGTPLRGLAPLPGRENWKLEGDLEALDLSVSRGAIEDGDYPDALVRLDAALNCAGCGDVLASARLGWEFVDLGGRSHSGGSHGSLHEADSIAPLLTFGLDWAQDDEDHPAHKRYRLAEVAPLIQRHFAREAVG
jgi:hypothetical protein